MQTKFAKFIQSYHVRKDQWPLSIILWFTYVTRKRVNRNNFRRRSVGPSGNRGHQRPFSPSAVTNSFLVTTNTKIVVQCDISKNRVFFIHRNYRYLYICECSVTSGLMKSVVRLRNTSVTFLYSHIPRNVSIRTTVIYNYCLS